MGQGNGMIFDRMAPGGGVDVLCRLEGGKAFLEWKLYFAEREEPEKSSGNRGGYVRITLTDAQGNTALECCQLPDEEEPLQSILLQPKLWQGVRNPYLYHLEAALMGGDGRCMDRVCRKLPLRALTQTGECEELLLNGEAFEVRGVRYCLPGDRTSSHIRPIQNDGMASGAARLQLRLIEDFQMLLQLGANCIFWDSHGDGKFFLQLCDRFGFLLFSRDKKNSGYVWPQAPGSIRFCDSGDIPSFRGGGECLLTPKGHRPSPLFYRYRARWSMEPFVYIVPESIRKTESGNYTALCYSNCGRVALYSDGVLFEFQKGSMEFLFREIPAKSPCIMLTAEGDGCSQSLSMHKSYVARNLL